MLSRNSLSGLLGVVLCALLTFSCTGSKPPTQPTPVDPGAPHITCPATPPPIQASDSTGALVSYEVATVALGATPLSGPTCNPPSGSKFVVGSTTVTCTVSDSKARTDSCTFPVVVQSPPRLLVTRFLAFGDSMTAGEDGNNSSAQGIHIFVQLPVPDTYPGALQSLLSARYPTQAPLVFNGGLRNELVTDSATFARFVRFTSTGQIDVVLLMEGANDISDRDSRVIPSVVASLRRMISDARSRSIKPYLATLPPQNPSGFRGLAWSLVPTLNDALRGLASSEGIPLVDVYQAFNGDVTTLISGDGLHPTSAGYHKIADTFMTAFRQTLEAPTTTTAFPIRSNRAIASPARR